MARKIKVKIYDELNQSLTGALAYERGEQVDLRVVELPPAPKAMKPREIRKIRESLNASQAAFAHYLCVSPKAIQSWEQGVRRPRSAALRLLTIARSNPRVLLQS